MPESRRQWLTTFAAGLGALALGRAAFAQMSPTARPLPSPNAPNEHAPAGLDRPPMAGAETKGLDPKLQFQIKDDVEKIFQLASDLKKQVEGTDLNSVLSLGIVKKAQEIEKLAKHVKEHAKG